MLACVRTCVYVCMCASVHKCVPVRVRVLVRVCVCDALVLLCVSVHVCVCACVVYCVVSCCMVWFCQLPPRPRKRFRSSHFVSARRARGRFCTAVTAARASAVQPALLSRLSARRNGSVQRSLRLRHLWLNLCSEGSARVAKEGSRSGGLTLRSAAHRTKPIGLPPNNHSASE